MRYESRWRTYYVAAFFIHLVAWLFITLAVPHLLPKPDAPEVVELEWTDYDEFGGDEGVAEAAPTPPEPPAPEPNPEPIPDVEIIEPEVAETPVEAETVEEAIEQLKAEEKADPKKEIGNVAVRGNSNGQTMGEPAKLIREVQPTPGAISFRGRISVSAHIDREGRVVATKIMISSGNTIYDNVAMNIVRKEWKFEPATDVKGEPMESNYICSLYFNVKQHRRN